MLNHQHKFHSQFLTKITIQRLNKNQRFFANGLKIFFQRFHISTGILTLFANIISFGVPIVLCLYGNITSVATILDNIRYLGKLMNKIGLNFFFYLMKAWTKFLLKKIKKNFFFAFYIVKVKKYVINNHDSLVVKSIE